VPAVAKGCSGTTKVYAHMAQRGKLAGAVSPKKHLSQFKAPLPVAFHLNTDGNAAVAHQVSTPVKFRIIGFRAGLTSGVYGKARPLYSKGQALGLGII
jgi:hypothetical protein